MHAHALQASGLAYEPLAEDDDDANASGDYYGEWQERMERSQTAARKGGAQAQAAGEGVQVGVNRVRVAGRLAGRLAGCAWDTKRACMRSCAHALPLLGRVVLLGDLR